MASPIVERDDARNLLRQQLILAQVRLMEIEDARDEALGKLASVEQLLTEAQRLADAKLDEAAHLERARTDLQQQFDHLRHQQHVTHVALEAARAQLAIVEASLANEKQASTGLQLQLVENNEALRDLTQRRVELETEGAARLASINALAGEVRAMNSSRSWRWTAWLRALERALGASK